MFTGIIQGFGTVRGLAKKGPEGRLEVDSALDLSDIKTGDSIAVNGACLTVTTRDGNRFSADVSAETLERTTLKGLRTGARVNLEKALRLTDFLGGHLVLGHVDAVGRIVEKTDRGTSIVFGFEIPGELAKYIVEKGSVAVDGISLTVNRCENNRFYVNVIPHTAGQTTLGFRKVADAVNIETDILGKYIEKLLPGGKGGRGIDLAFLAEHGFGKGH
ncbi:MAG TPA: riboflavin synthase [Syntrophales bacterium]|nr:riboflavin synthase [Syntrophales bacterium]